MSKKKTVKKTRVAPSVRLRAGERVAIGLMSGTSADGVDAAILAVTGSGLKVRYRLLGHHERPYPPALRKRVLDTMAPARVSVESLCDLNFELAEVFAATAIEAIDAIRLPREKVNLIASHGQTVCHLPPGRPGQSKTFGSTLQLADPGVIAARTGIITVGNFRTGDMAVGGQGAPLVPITDWLMFADRKVSRIVLNIGGIANITYLPAGGGPADVLAFDTGPGNCLLDVVAQVVTKGRLQFDVDGKLAAAGQVLTEFLVDWLEHPYFKRRPPKSTGREDFSRPLVERWLRHVLAAGATAEDMMATLTELTATTIANAIKQFVAGRFDEVIVYGGGSTNPTLMAALTQLLGQPIRLIERFGIHPKAKEAASFALLGLLRIDHVSGNVLRATGAQRPVILGGVYRP
ncbi:MAG: anhydro-N-acetylmuramic acid kinase [Phycisphaerae bacterium]|nr:anhydro-N-acetylmuramic acid kinase [Phycisphaerae bacterium]